MARAAKANGNTCDWIGPPHLNPGQSKGFPPERIAKEEKNLNSFYDSMATSVDQSCNVVESREATAPGTPGYETVDGVHRTDSAGKYWSAAIVGQLLGDGGPANATGRVAK
jgi:hypothetical protein